jgi:ribosome-binding factor A
MTIRQERIQELIHNHLSMLLLTDVTDPALQGLTVTDVKVDREIEYADVFIQALGEDEREQEIMHGLKRANGFLRRELATRLRIRNMPILRFYWDHSLANAEHIEALLDSLNIEPEPVEDADGDE